MIDNNKIQQAANNYVGHEPETDESCYVSTKRDAFKDGATWMQKEFVKNLWHDLGDEPDNNRLIICIDECGMLSEHSYYSYKASAWKLFTDAHHTTLWCYKNDIIP